MSEISVETRKDTLNIEIKFGGLNNKVVTENFKGGQIKVTFGGVEIDLRESKINKKGTATLEINAEGGGVKLLIPTTWFVEGTLKSTAGGYKNSANSPKNPEGTLVLKGKILFGGVEVSN